VTKPSLAQRHRVARSTPRVCATTLLLTRRRAKSGLCDRRRPAYGLGSWALNDNEFLERFSPDGSTEWIIDGPAAQRGAWAFGGPAAAEAGDPGGLRPRDQLAQLLQRLDDVEAIVVSLRRARLRQLAAARRQRAEP
jgi:hypothetical protein